MKLATYRSGGQDKIGIVHGGDRLVFDLAAAASRSGAANPSFASMLALIDAGEGALEQAAKLLDQHGKDESLSAQVANVEILAPVPEPRQMRDGMSFPLHILQAPRGQHTSLGKLVASGEIETSMTARTSPMRPVRRPPGQAT